MELDRIDYDILKCLEDNARMRASAISQQVNLSVSAVIERIRKLETSGIIQKYTIVKDQKQLGNDMLALMEVSLEHPRYCDGFIKAIANHQNVVSCFYMTGDFDFMLKILADSSDSLERIHGEIKRVEGVCGTRTHYVLKLIKDEFVCTPDE